MTITLALTSKQCFSWCLDLGEQEPCEAVPLCWGACIFLWKELAYFL